MDAVQPDGSQGGSPQAASARPGVVAEITRLGRQELLHHAPPGEEAKSIGSSFFRGSKTNFNPYARDFLRRDFLRRFLLKGWMPEEPLLDQTTRITAFGSCFAANITNHLSRIGYSLSKDRNPEIHISTMGEGLVNVHALAEQFEWALEGTMPPRGLWHGFQCEEFGYDEDIRERTRAAMLETDFFIVTLGLSEVWYDSLTGGIFWRAVPQSVYDESRHTFRVCSMAETKERIARIHALIRRHVPQAKILFTLSPVPLAATFRPVGCLTANAASKAILRAALDEHLREQAMELNRSLFYFPSYEIITDLFFCRYEEDGRHPQPEIVKFIMRLFEFAYCRSGLAYEAVADEFAALRAENARICLDRVGLSPAGS